MLTQKLETMELKFEGFCEAFPQTGCVRWKKEDRLKQTQFSVMRDRCVQE